MPIHSIPGFTLTDHTFQIPLDHARPNGEKISVFAREVNAPGRDPAGKPWLVFFQGGPGHPAPRPPASAGWLKRATQDYRVLLLDQRGTGLSTPLTFQTLARFPTPQAQADYLKHFRADAIVQDAEWIRRELAGGQPWTGLGQSYGGFCLAHYLSAAPEGLSAAIITGGLPPLTRPVDDVYRATYRRVIQKNERYYARYPGDVDRAQRVARALSATPARLPTGDLLSARRFQQLGMGFGADTGLEEVHYLLEEAFVGDELSYTFLRHFENTHAFDTNPLYVMFQEIIYCQGAAARWSAERLRSEYPQFALTPDQPVYFTGEMMYPWQFDEQHALRPLKEATEILANYDGWPALYDVNKLRANTVPVVAAIYHNDMYVEREFSEETAQTIRGTKTWVTSEYEHNGLRADGEKVLGRLLGMLRGEI